MHTKIKLSILFLVLANLLHSQPLFSLLDSSETQLNFTNTLYERGQQSIFQYANFYGGAGVGVIDVNNDGLQDLYFTGNLVGDKLYLNKGGLKFQDISQEAGIVDDGSWSSGVTIADVNNDGFQDIYVSKELYDYSPALRTNKLYINQGNNRFKEQAATYGVDHNQRTRQAVFFDYDKDGFLDLFLLTQPPNPGSYSQYFGKSLLQPEYTCRLLRNIQGTRFEDVTVASGLYRAGFPNAVSVADYNNDGHLDLYIANDFYAPDFYYINNGDGTFTDLNSSAFKHTSFYSMGVDAADLNNDDLLDLIVVDMSAENNFRLKSNMSGMNPADFWAVVNGGGNYQYMYNTVHLNNSQNRFSDIAQLTGMQSTDWSWSPLIADFDNDGYKDVHITNGLLRDIRNTDATKKVTKFINLFVQKYLKDHPTEKDINLWDILDVNQALQFVPSQKLANYAFKNLGGLNFQKTAQEWGLAQKSFSNGSAYADLDNDGDLDLVINNINEQAFLYRNNSANKSIRIKLTDSKLQRSPIGTRLYLYTSSMKQTYEIASSRGIYSSSEQIAHFGIPQNDKIIKLEILWQDGSKTVKEKLVPGTTLSIDRATAAKTPQTRLQPKKYFAQTNLEGIQYKHKEDNYDDYKYQVLLPHKMSQFGPSLSVGDLDGDGREDVLLGGAKGQPMQVFRQTTSSKFVLQPQPIFIQDTAYEDVDSRLLDLDLDGDLDLYVVSGGAFDAEDSSAYQDRIYLNDGNGKFTKNTRSQLPYTSGGVVKAFDFNQDGRQDIFVGGRHSPKHYPEPTSSYLLKNTTNGLVDVTNKLAPQLKKIGMVTDAVWSDFDGDGNTDLILVGEWMPITILYNHKGSFTKMEQLQNTTGWWNAIEVADLNGDGRDDYLLGNNGLNYKYKATTEEPFEVFYYDFDKNNSKDIVLSYYNYGEQFPLRGFSCSSQQIPKLKKIGSYDVFASMKLEQLYGKDKLESSLHYAVNSFASGVLLSAKNKTHQFRAFDNYAQLSSINDFMLTDYNNDGHTDVIAVGNVFGSEIETPRNDAGYGFLLQGDGEGNFKSIPTTKSGLYNQNDAKKIKRIRVGGKTLFIIANNNDTISVYERTD